MIEKKNLRCKCRYKDCERLDKEGNGDKLLIALSKFQKLLGDKHVIYATNGYRCAKHNKDVGGVKSSQHTLGKAADIKCRSLAVECLFGAARDSELFTGIGIYNTFIHVDIRDKDGRWDKRETRRKELLPIKLR